MSNLDNGAMLTLIQDRIEMMQDELSSLLAMVQELEKRKSFTEVQGRRD